MLLVIFHCLRPFISIIILRFNFQQLTLLIGLITFHLRAARRAFAVTRWGNRTGLPHPRAVMASSTANHCCYSAWVASLPLNPWFSSRVGTSREPSRDDAMPRPIAITLMSLAFFRCRDGDYVHQSGSAFSTLRKMAAELSLRLIWRNTQFLTWPPSPSAWRKVSQLCPEKPCSMTAPHRISRSRNIPVARHGERRLDRRRPWRPASSSAMILSVISV